MADIRRGGPIALNAQRPGAISHHAGVDGHPTSAADRREDTAASRRDLLVFKPRQVSSVAAEAVRGSVSRPRTAAASTMTVRASVRRPATFTVIVDPPVLHPVTPLVSAPSPAASRAAHG